MKIVKIVFAISCITLHPLYALVSGNYISYQLTPGRLGDHLLAATKAELAAELELKHSPQNKISVVHAPFEWSDHLALSKQPPHKACSGNRRLILKTYKPGIASRLRNCTLLCTLKTDIYIDKDNKIDNFNKLYEYTRNNPDFKSRLQGAIAPLHEIETIALPQDKISVAVHVRTGGGFDKISLMNKSLGKNSAYTKRGGYSNQIHPQRFPPESYYTQQLEVISTMLNHQPLFVHIFTDDQDPIAITKRFQEKLNHLSNITYSCRATGNAHNLHVIDDLFNMARFDCLIRPASSYSKMAQLLGNHSIITYPKQVVWIKGVLVANKVGIINHLTNLTSLGQI